MTGVLRRAAFGLAAGDDGPGVRLPVGRRLAPGPRSVARGIGLARMVLGGTFLVAPVLSVRVLGMDTATAKRVTYLARMTAGRDIVLGAGTFCAGSAGPWLLAGAAADAIDAAVIASAIRQGNTRGLPAAGTVAAAAVTAAVGTRAALGLRRRSVGVEPAGLG